MTSAEETARPASSRSTTPAKPRERADPAPTIGELPDLEAERLIRTLELDPILSSKTFRTLATGEPEAASALKSAWLFSRERPYMYTAHAFGFISADGNNTIQHAGKIPPDNGLTRITIRLNALRVADYPGDGVHHVLFDFYAENHLPNDVIESVHFSQTYRALEGQEAGIIGYPVFVGLNVGPEGVAFRCFTVNVKNDDDEKLLGFLDGDVFKQGLKLATAAQPAIAPLSQMALGVAKGLLSRNKNVKVQDFYLGLDFGGSKLGARLAAGDYVAVQIPDKALSTWDWSQWVYNPDRGHIVAAADGQTLIPYNYVVFSVTKYTGN